MKTSVKRLKNAKSFLMIDDSKSLVDEDMKVIVKNKRIEQISKGLDNASSQGEYIGIMHINESDRAIYANMLKELIEAADLKRHYEYALNKVLDKIDLVAESTQAYEWTEIDTLEDLEKARGLECVNSVSLIQ